jgi:hydrocephalus-inducing protein
VFQLHAPPHFTITPTQGTLDVGSSMQLALSFQPPGAELYQGHLEVCYDTGERTVTRCAFTPAFCGRRHA